MTPNDLGDAGNAVRVAIDPPNRVAHVHVLRAEAVTTPEELDAAVSAGYRAALVEGRRTPNRQARRERPVARSTRVTLPPLKAESYHRHQVREASKAERARSRGNPGTVTGRSTNDCVTVTLAPASAAGRVDADPGWLRTATATSISRAVTEAFVAAYAERDR